MSTTTALTSEQRAALRNVVRRHPGLRILTVRQPHADLIIAGVKDMLSLSYPPPSTLPQWGECDYHGRVGPDLLEFVEAPTFDYWRHWPRDGYQCPVTLDGPFPFTLGIHAAKTEDPHAPPIYLTDDIREPWEALPWYDGWLHEDATPFGMLLGFVPVKGCHHADDTRDCFPNDPCPVLGGDAEPCDDDHFCSRWAQPDQYHWMLGDPEPLDTPVPMRGRPRLWTPPTEAPTRT